MTQRDGETDSDGTSRSPDSRRGRADAPNRTTRRRRRAMSRAADASPGQGAPRGACRTLDAGGSRLSPGGCAGPERRRLRCAQARECRARGAVSAPQARRQPQRQRRRRPRRGFSKHTHAQRMMSLSNAFADEDVQISWPVSGATSASTARRWPFTAEPKIDGLSLSLRYENGRWSPAATRGDGVGGRERHRQRPHHRRHPDRIDGAPEVLEVRGEVYMSHADFDALNARQAEAGRQDLRQSAQRRRRVAAPARCRDHARRPLRFFAYAWGELSAPLADTQSGALERLAALAFPPTR
jgi:NAD-dependent DNA ligase